MQNMQTASAASQAGGLKNEKPNRLQVKNCPK